MPKYRLPVMDALPVDTELAGRRVVFVTNPNARSLEYFGPLQVFDEARIFFEHANRAELGYQVEVVSTGVGPVYERRGFAIEAPIPYDQLQGPVDTLILQAADEADACLDDAKFIAWVADMATRVRRIVSICTGSFILGEAGVLDGRRATTHWCAFEDFKRRYPEVTLDRDAIFVKDGNVYTSAGATSGMDLAVALIEEDFGSAFARRVAQGLVMFLRRPAFQSQFSVHVVTESSEDPRIRAVIAYVDANLDADLRIETLAARFSMSQRTFVRLFTATIGVSPGRYIEQARLEHARQLLEDTNLPVARIAERCGYRTGDGLRIAFERNLATTPKSYRDRFATAVGRGA